MFSLQGLVALVVIGVLGWGAYSFSPLPECRAAAADLEDAKRFHFGAGPSWGAFDIANCALMPTAERSEQIAAIQTYKWTSQMVFDGIRRDGL
jgi:hypothetical protein